MNFFCHNSLCRCHVELPDGMQVMRYTEANGNEVNIGRRQIVNTETKAAFNFCEICANAVALIFGKRQQP